MRENLDAMARRLGEMQARMVQLEALVERVSGLAGVNTAELKANPGPRRRPDRGPSPVGARNCRRRWTTWSDSRASARTCSRSWSRA
jgi:hypothetical protein